MVIDEDREKALGLLQEATFRLELALHEAGPDEMSVYTTKQIEKVLEDLKTTGRLLGLYK